MEEKGLTRKEKLALWRARKGEEATAPQPRAHHPGTSRNLSSGKVVLAARPGAGNIVKEPVLRRSKEKVTRKPFQVDMRVVREASERRVAPGTPIHSLKKRIKRPGDELDLALVQEDKEKADHVAHKSESAGTTAARRVADSGAVQNPRRYSKGNPFSTTVSAHTNGIRRIVDTARMKEVSEFLKSQISEANLLLEISGVDAARTLLADLLSTTGVAGGVGELALYWAARAKLEEDAGMYDVARRTLDEGQAYISIPTQQKVLEKVCSAFEDRMNSRAEKEVEQLLEESNDTLNSSSGNNSNTNSNSPTSSTPFRYDPNELSLEDGEEGAHSAIKNLNFSKVTISEGTQSKTESASAQGLPISGLSVGGGSVGGIDEMPGVFFCDDDSDASIGDIDEAFIARAKAFNEEEEARKASREAKGHHDPYDACEEGRDPNGAAADSDVSMEDSGTFIATEPTSEGGEIVQESTTSRSSMPPPEARGSKKRKGTPHPKPKPRKDTPIRSKDTGEQAQAGTFIMQVESKGKDGKRTLTPVRRSRRISGSAQEPTPSPLRKEMEAML